jgi:hypothetical protein
MQTRRVFCKLNEKHIVQMRPVLCKQNKFHCNIMRDFLYRTFYCAQFFSKVYKAISGRFSFKKYFKFSHFGDRCFVKRTAGNMERLNAPFCPVLLRAFASFM